MAYATSDDLTAKWGSDLVALASADPETGVSSPLRIATALDAAAAQINGYLVQRYNLPVDASPDGATLLKSLCCDLAMGQLSNTPGARNEIVKEAIKDAKDFLELVAAGKAGIPQNPAPGAPAPSPQEAVMISDPREFSRDRLRYM
jgi:phage gp36-like protein